MARIQPHENVLVVQLTRFGDFLQTTPLLRALKTRLARGKLTVLVDRPQAGLAESNPDVDRVLSIDLKRLGQTANRDDLDLTEVVRAFSDQLVFLEKIPFDRVINLNTSLVAALVSELIPASHRDGPRLAADRQTLLTVPWTHFIMNLMTRRKLIRFNLVDLLTAYAEANERASDRLTHVVGPEDKTEAHALLRDVFSGPLVGLQLGSRHISRQWPPDNQAELAQRLIRDLGATMVLLGTETERPLGQAFLGRLKKLNDQLPARVLNLMGQTSLPILGGVLSQLDLLVTTDTGTMHMASAVGTPILGLFIGPAFCHETGPYGSGHVVLQVNMECSPCTEGRAACHDHPCRNLITPEHALTAAQWLLSNGRSPLPTSESLGPHVRLLISELDDFGVAFKPLVPYDLDRTEMLALAYREAGRGLIRPAYVMDDQSITTEAKRYHLCFPPDHAKIFEVLLQLENNLHELYLAVSPNGQLASDLSAFPDLEPLPRILKSPFLANQPVRGQRLVSDMVRVLGALGESAGLDLPLSERTRSSAG